MQNRKDLLQAHRLMTQRAALALLCGEPDSPNQPLRRLNVGALAGILVAALVAAVIAVIGFLAPGTVMVSGLTQPGMLVIDKDTATAYVPCENGKLCPAANYASALLALDTVSVDHVAVSQASIAKYPIGPTIGISGLPADLPLAASLVKGPWSVCASGLSSTLVGGVSVGGTGVGSGDAVLVADPQDAVWVVWHGERLLIALRVVAALFGNAQPVQVPDAWLDALPQGPDFAAPAIDGQGTVVNGPMSGTAVAGQVYTEGNGHYFVLLADGSLAPVSATVAQLLEAEPSAAGAQTIDPSTVTSHLAGTAVPDGGLPAAVPSLSSGAGALCVSYGPGMSGDVTVSGTVPGGGITIGNNGGEMVDQVWLPAGHGALIGAATSAADPPQAYFLVVGGMRYALSAPGVAEVLGYDLADDATVLPASVLDLLPQGPALDPATADRQP
jgi:type VII secretion protein EccB